jgi:hypothetical protein
MMCLYTGLLHFNNKNNTCVMKKVMDMGFNDVTLLSEVISFQYKKFWEELIAYFPLIRHGPHKKKDASSNYAIVAYIRCRDNAFTEPLPSNDRGIHIQTHRLMGGIYEVRR